MEPTTSRVPALRAVSVTSVDERTIIALAAQQECAVTTRQLAAAGLTRDAIAYRVATGTLRRKYRGVYLLGPLDTPLTSAVAAVLACGDAAVLSHHNAAALYAIRPPYEGDVHISLTRGQCRQRAGIKVHRGHVAPDETTRHQGIRTTTPARTLHDLTPHLPRRDLERAIEQAEVLRLPGCTPYPAPFPTPESRLTRSEAERKVLELIRAARLPIPRTNTRLHGYEVDLLWPDQRLVVEVDGYAFHSHRAAFERDRRRDA